MNEKILKQAGFGKEVELVKNNKCPLCQVLINEKSFKDTMSIKEFKISGLCQDCQDKIFGK